MKNLSQIETEKLPAFLCSKNTTIYSIFDCL